MNTDQESFIKSMARTLWVTAYADYMEDEENAIDDPDFDDRENASCGTDWFDIAPEEHESALEAAQTYWAMLGAENQQKLLAFVAAMRLVLAKADKHCDNLAHYTMMQARGEGVDWDGYADDHGLTEYPITEHVPYFDCVTMVYYRDQLELDGYQYYAEKYGIGIK